MAKKHHAHHGPPVALRPRIDLAVSEGRFQQALELTKQLFKYEPTPEHRALLHTVYLGRGRQLRSQGYLRDASTTLQAALHPPGLSDAWKQEIAEELAACGDVSAALALAGPTSERVLAHAVDSALQQQAAGKKLLPPSLHADFDRVLLACQQLEGARDEDARATLQGIGLGSPFLEWKVLLRGLLAYYHNDDARALENWQRLDPERLPARLAAPLRFSLDVEFRRSQPPDTQTHLQKQADRLQGSNLLQQLRQLQITLAREPSMAQVLRQADALLPVLRQDAPQLVARLASCLYWAVLQHGGPDDVTRYQRVFGAPADDRSFHRLNAIGFERGGDLKQAHEHWQKFEKEVTDRPEAWPVGHAARVRALVWQHMGQNAASIPSNEKVKDLPPFLRNHPDRPKPLKPTAEQCFRRSLELAPDRLAAHEALFEYFRGEKKDEPALAAARALLARFPDHVATLQELGQLLQARQEYAEALALFQRALKNNPLDPLLRGRVSNAHAYTARSHAEAGRFDDARAAYQAALNLSGPGGDSAILCKWAACEFKADDSVRAEELLHQALAQAGNRLAVTYSLLIEVIRLKLPGALKTRFNHDFNAGLAETATGAAAAALALTTASHERAGVTYHGQKTHRKKVIDYVKKAARAVFTEEELERLCVALLDLDAYRLVGQFTSLGRRTFPRNPAFPLFEAQNHLSRGPGTFSPYAVRQLLDQADQLARALPPDRKREALLEDIERRRQLVGLADPFGQLFGGGPFPFDDMFGFDDEFDDEDDGW